MTTTNLTPFTFRDLCSYIEYWGMEERWLASHQLSDSDNACIARILQRFQREGRLRGVSGEEQMFVRALEQGYNRYGSVRFRLFVLREIQREPPVRNRTIATQQKMNKNYSVKDCHLFDVPTYIDERGALSVLDKDLPFQVRRVFWLHHIGEGKDRGAHALLDNTEIMVAVHGSFVVELDDTENKTSILLDSPNKGLIIRPGVWFRTHSYKNDGVSLILAEEEYSRKKYTYDYEEFFRLRNI